MTFIGLLPSSMTKHDEIVIIGHTGFIGSKLVQIFKKEKNKLRGISTSEIDFTKQNSTRKLRELVSSDTVLIVAAAITREKGDTLGSLSNHIKMISNIATALEYQKIRKCIFLSSADVYGIPERLPITENTKISPVTYYALAKSTGEKIFEVATKKSKTDLLIIRFNGIYGYGQKNIGYGPNAFFAAIVNNKVVEIWGKGEEKRDNVYVEDLARAIVELYKHNAKGIYNIATGESISFSEMLKIIKLITKTNFKIKYKSRTSGSFDQIFDNSKFLKAVQEFSFTSKKIAFKQTLAQYE